VNILVVDDEEEICEMLSRHFRYLGYGVHTAPDGQTALDKLAQEKIDIVISDIRMPRMSGIELLREIRKEYPMIHVIMLTGYVTLENALACMRLGADTCVFKPLEDMAPLEKAVAHAVEEIQNWLSILHELVKMKPAAGIGGE